MWFRSKNFVPTRNFLTANIESPRRRIHFPQMVDDALNGFLIVSQLVAKTLKIGAGDLHAQIAQMTLKNFFQQKRLVRCKFQVWHIIFPDGLWSTEPPTSAAP